MAIQILWMFTQGGHLFDSNRPSTFPEVDDVSAVNPSKDSWTIVVKVNRMWVSPCFGGSKLPFSMELVFMDAKGCKIHATVRKSLVYRFQPLITEGRVYQISSFSVGENGGEFRTTTHTYKINFEMHTTVRLATNTPITMSPYSFTPLSDIRFNVLDSSYLTDVIGILTGSSGEQEFEKDGKLQKRITLELFQDGVRLECAFFGKYVPEILGQLASGDMTNAVVIVQFAKMKPFRGIPSIQNVYGATKILFNPDVEEAAPLRERFFALTDPASQVLSQLQDSCKVPIAEDFLNLTQGKTIEQIKVLTEKSTCAVLATVKFIPEGPWWYPACKCNKKVYSADGMFFCENCVRHMVLPIPRYKLQVRVVDTTESTTFVIFDQEASVLLNKPCAALVKDPTKDPADFEVPAEVLELIDQTFLFKIEVNNSSNSIFEPSYRVKKICSDSEVMCQFQASLPSIEGSAPLLIMGTPTSVLKGESSSSIIVKDLNAEFVNAGNPKIVETSNSPAVDLSSDTQQISPVPSDPTPNVKIVGDKSAKHDMTLKEVEPAGELDINKSADSDGSRGKQSPRATAVPLACLSSTKKSTKTYLKSKEKKKSVGDESAEVIQVVEAAKEPEVDVSVESQISPPAKRPSPSDAEVVGVSVAGKKPLKAVKKEKI